MDLPKVSIQDMWRAYNRELYNRSRGKRGKWLRARHSVHPPKWFVSDVKAGKRPSQLKVDII